MHLWRYVFASQYVHDRIVMDIACGVGYGTRYLAEKGAKKVFGVDLDTDALKFADNQYNFPNIQYVHGNGLRLPFEDDSIDTIISFETIEHIPVEQQEAFVAEIHRIVKSQGVFLCSSLNHEFSPGHVDHTREFLPNELFGMIRRYFGQVREYGQFISAEDLAFQQAQIRRLGFQLKRKRNILLRRAGNWFRADPARMVLRNLIKHVFRRNKRPGPLRKPVYLTDTLIAALDPQYAPVPLSENNIGVLFDPIAVCFK